MKNSDSNAWRVQVWITFIVAVGGTGVGISQLPVNYWMRGFLAMGLLFCVSSTLSLAKTVRDKHEESRLRSKIDEAKTERILREYEVGSV